MEELAKRERRKNFLIRLVAIGVSALLVIGVCLFSRSTSLKATESIRMLSIEEKIDEIITDVPVEVGEDWLPTNEPVISTLELQMN